MLTVWTTYIFYGVKTPYKLTIFPFIFIHSVHDDFKTVIKECYAPYSPSAEDKNPFGKMNGSA